MDREKVIQHLESEIYRAEQSVNDIWLECVEVKLLRDALALLKEQESWINEIAEYQQSISGSGMHELDDYEKGKWDGLQIAWNIVSEGR